MSRFVAGVFPSRESAEHAVDELMQLGLSRKEISLLMSDQTQKREFVAPEAPKPANATIAGVLGTIGAGLAAVGALSSRSLVATGPIVGSLARLGTGVMADGLTSALVALGVPEVDAKFLDREIRRGGILMGIHLGKEASDLERDDRPEWNRMDLEEVAGLT